jgi:hypothetical protein
MNSTNGTLRSTQPILMEQLPAEEILDIYKKIIRELIGAWDLDEESTDSEPLPARVG